MPRGSPTTPRRSAETPASLRAKAAHARRLAESSADPKTETELTDFARELDVKAAELEQQSTACSRTER